MKRRNALLSACLVLTIVAVASIGNASAKGGGSASAGAATGTVQLFAFEDTLDPKVLAGFRKANPGIKLETAAFANSDEAVAKLRAGFKSDVVELCVRDTPRMAAAGVLAAHRHEPGHGLEEPLPGPARRLRRQGQAVRRCTGRRHGRARLQRGQAPRRHHELQAAVRGSAPQGQGHGRGRSVLRARSRRARHGLQEPLRAERLRPEEGHGLLHQAQVELPQVLLGRLGLPQPVPERRDPGRPGLPRLPGLAGQEQGQGHLQVGQGRHPDLGVRPGHRRAREERRRGLRPDQLLHVRQDAGLLRQALQLHRGQQGHAQAAAGRADQGHGPRQSRRSSSSAIPTQIAPNYDKWLEAWRQIQAA